MSILPMISKLNFLLENSQNHLFDNVINKIRNCCIIKIDYIELKFYIEIFIDFLTTINKINESCETILQILMFGDFNCKMEEIKKINDENQNIKLILNDQAKSFQHIFEIFDYIYINKDTIQNDNPILTLIPGFKIEMLTGLTRTNENEVFRSKGVETQTDINFDSSFFKIQDDNVYIDSFFHNEIFPFLDKICNGKEFKVKHLLKCIVNIYFKITTLYENTNILFYSVEFEKYKNFKLIFENVFKRSDNYCDDFYLNDQFEYFNKFTCLFQILTDSHFNSLFSLAVINAKNIIINEKRIMLNNTLSDKIKELNDNKKFIFCN